MADTDRRHAVEARAAVLRAMLAGRDDVAEKRMFGGLTFMVAGHMCCGATPDCFVFRVGPGRYDEALSLPGVRPCDFTGRPLGGMVMTCIGTSRPAPGLETLASWSLDFVSALPPRR